MNTSNYLSLRFAQFLSFSAQQIFSVYFITYDLQLRAVYPVSRQYLSFVSIAMDTNFPLNRALPLWIHRLSYKACGNFAKYNLNSLNVLPGSKACDLIYTNNSHSRYF